MKSLILAFLLLSFAQHAIADQSICKDSSQNAKIYVKMAVVTNSNIALTLSDDSVVNGTIIIDQAGASSLDEQTSAKINLEVTLSSHEGQNILLVSPLMSMEIPQVLLCE